MSVRSVSPVVLFESTISLLILCLDHLSIVESEILKSPTIIVLLFISPLTFGFLLYVFRYFNVRHINIYNCYIFLMD